MSRRSSLIFVAVVAGMSLFPAAAEAATERIVVTITGPGNETGDPNWSGNGFVSISERKDPPDPSAPAAFCNSDGPSCHTEIANSHFVRSGDTITFLDDDPAAKRCFALQVGTDPGGTSTGYFQDPDGTRRDFGPFSAGSESPGTTPADCRPNAPPIVSVECFTVKPGGVLTVPAPGVLANDYDPDGDDPLTAELRITSFPRDRIDWDGRGGFTFRPNTEPGVAEITYVAKDSRGAESEPMLVRVYKQTSPTSCYETEPLRCPVFPSLVLDVQTDGGPGGDTLAGSAVKDLINGAAGDDRIRGGDGTDCLLGGAGLDWILGNAGGDVIDGGPDRDEVDGKNGADDIRGGDGPDTVLGGHQADRLSGGGGTDLLSDGSGTNLFKGGPGGDYISARQGRGERILCGAGHDEAFVDRNDITSGCELVHRQPSPAPQPVFGGTSAVARAAAIKLPYRVFHFQDEGKDPWNFRPVTIQMASRISNRKAAFCDQEERTSAAGYPTYGRIKVWPWAAIETITNEKEEDGKLPVVFVRWKYQLQVWTVEGTLLGVGSEYDWRDVYNPVKKYSLKITPQDYKGGWAYWSHNAKVYFFNEENERYRVHMTVTYYHHKENGKDHKIGELQYFSGECDSGPPPQEQQG